MYSVEVEFKRGDTVFGINRFTRSIFKSVVEEVRYTKYPVLDSASEIGYVSTLKYHMRDQALDIIIFLDAEDTFATYEEATAALYTGY
jgi:hypothetical protein